MRLVRDDSENVADWVAHLLPDVREMGFGACKAIGVIGRGAEPLGGVVFHHYDPQHRTISISCAAVTPRWLTRSIIAEILGYAFEEIGMFKVWAAISMHNARSLKLIKGIGFSQEATLRHQFGPKHHAIVYGMIAPEFAAKYRKDRNIRDQPVQQAQSANAA